MNSVRNEVKASASNVAGLLIAAGPVMNEAYVIRIQPEGESMASIAMSKDDLREFAEDILISIAEEDMEEDEEEDA